MRASIIITLFLYSINSYSFEWDKLPIKEKVKKLLSKRPNLSEIESSFGKAQKIKNNTYYYSLTGYKYDFITVVEGKKSKEIVYRPKEEKISIHSLPVKIKEESKPNSEGRSAGRFLIYREEEVSLKFRNNSKKTLKEIRVKFK